MGLAIIGGGNICAALLSGLLDHETPLMDPAEELVIQTAVGAAVMLRDSGEDPVSLRAAVSSPGGTTITLSANSRRPASVAR